MSTPTMHAVVLDEPGPVTNLHVRDLPIPTPAPGWVRIKVHAFGLNRSELHTRLGLAEGVVLPRVLGIEATGVVDAAPGGEFPVGAQVMTIMGGMAGSSTVATPNTPASPPARSSRSTPSWNGPPSARSRRCSRPPTDR